MNQKIILFIGAIFFAAFAFQVDVVFARENVTDWYIKDFDSRILLQKDSTLDITENITADCGMAIGKHGIFRILPTRVNIDGKKIENPIELLSVTDENGRALKYSETMNSNDGTVTWKIGDPKVTVQGVNYYKIHYIVKNAIRFQNEKFDELYWNLSGNFWQLEIDKFHASIVFPNEINEKNSKVEYYADNLGGKGKELATTKWSSTSVLEFTSTATLGRIEGARVPGGLPLIFYKGITASVAFPKGIVTPYKPSFWEKNGKYFFLLIPLGVLFICFVLWKKYGEDPKLNKTIIPEYDVPENLSPIELGMLMKNGGFNNSFITGEIVFFATKGLISIKEIENKILFFSSKDFELTQNHAPEVEVLLSMAEKKILMSIFQTGSVVNLSELKNKFYKNLSGIKAAARNGLKNKGLIQVTGLNIGTVMRIVSPLLLWQTFNIERDNIFLAISFGISAVVIFAFSFIMPKRTPKGAELNWKIQGFKLFMETVDKDRAAFYEKENIFEKCLPYAIVFGMTKIWIKKMQEIYGADFYATHIPLWYVGNLGAFDADNFASTIDNLSSEIASNTSAPSGSGGAGMSGGGGGGGGGGGW